MKISMVVAAAENNAIGKDNKLLWHLPKDLKFFKETTMGYPIVMGRSTFESVGKPLPGRRNIVMTRSAGLSFQGCEMVHSVDEVLQLLRTEPQIMIVGGAEIYRLFMPIADRIYLTRVHTSPDADTFFEAIDKGQWRNLSKEYHPADEKHLYAFTFEIWDRLS